MVGQGRVLMFRTRPLAPRSVFVLRLAQGIGKGMVFIGAGLLVGAVGYRLTEGLGWLDATLNAAMLLAGEGPIAPLHTTGGKVFAIVYAIFSGVLFITATSVLLSPVAHRFLHRLHLEISDGDESAE